VWQCDYVNDVDMLCEEQSNWTRQHQHSQKHQHVDNGILMAYNKWLLHQSTHPSQSLHNAVNDNLAYYFKTSHISVEPHGRNFRPRCRARVNDSPRVTAWQCGGQESNGISDAWNQVNRNWYTCCLLAIARRWITSRNCCSLFWYIVVCGVKERSFTLLL